MADIHRSRRWRQARRQVLASEPLCRVCKRPAREVDHVVPLFRGGEAFDFDNLQPLCRKCHWRKNRREQSKGPKICVHGWPENLEDKCPDCEAEGEGEAAAEG